MASLKGRAHLLPEEINTDLHCSAKYMPGKDAVYIAQHAFEQLDAGFVGRFNTGDMIVAGRDFGINSSREQAVHVMRMMGVSAIVAASFGRQFFRNAINNGLPLVECDIGGIAENDELELDLSAGMMKVPACGIARSFAPLPAAIRALLAEGGLIPFLQRYPDWKTV